MKIRDGFVLRELVGEHLVVPVGEAAERLHGLIRLNETSVFLWNLLSRGDQTEKDLADAIAGEYAVDPETAKRDVADFISDIEAFGCI